MKVAVMSASSDLARLCETLRAARPGYAFALWPEEEWRDAQAVVAWDAPVGAYAEMPNLALIQSVAAGIDNVVNSSAAPGIPVCRIVDPLQAAGMLEYVHWAVTYFHRRFDDLMKQQATSLWRRPGQRPASEVAVGVMGMGTIGAHVARGLARAGYRVRGWSRSGLQDAGFEVHAGAQGFGAFLSGLEILVCLLPLNDETRGLLCARTFDVLVDGAALVHCGRGEHLVENDLKAALDSGKVRGAVVDVFNHEPLPGDHWMWKHPDVLVTPHIASEASGATVIQQIVENLDRLHAAEPLARVAVRTAQGI